MYLERFWTENLLPEKSLSVDCRTGNGEIRRWTILADEGSNDLSFVVKLLGVCLGGGKYLPTIESQLRDRVDGPGSHALFATVLRKDPPPSAPKSTRGGHAVIQYLVDKQEGIQPSGVGLSRRLGVPAAHRAISDTQSPFGRFAYAYPSVRGRRSASRLGRDPLPRARSSRFETCFADAPELTPPEEWLARQHRNACRYNSGYAERVFNVSMSAITSWFPDLCYSHLEDQKRLCFKRGSRTLSLADLGQGQVEDIEFLVDFVRQMADSERMRNGFNFCQGVLIVDGIENLLRRTTPEAASTTLASLFPNMQYVLTCTDPELARYFRRRYRAAVPTPSPTSSVREFARLKHRRAEAEFPYQRKNDFKKARFVRRKNVPKDTVVLVDVDSAIPNLALMRLSAHYKNAGRRVVLARDSLPYRHCREVFASCVFWRPTNRHKLDRLRTLHGEHLTLGGSGVDLSLRLPEPIEARRPDYSLYPGVDYGLGFLTRGCPGRCDFCIVPRKEGKLRTVAGVDDLLAPGQKKLVLLDDNLLASPDAESLLRELKARSIKVNFNQTLDLRYLTQKKARLLLDVDSTNFNFTRRRYFFSLNRSKEIPLIEEKLRLLPGLAWRETAFVCMYGHDTTLSDDLRRFRFLQELPAVPFVQEYEPVSGSPAPSVSGYFDTDIEPVLSIVFRENGRNFERFLKWVSRRYAEEFGELYMPLVDMIFRYNRRQQKHRYIESLAGLKKCAEEAP